MEVRVQRGLIAQRLGTVVGDGQRHGQLLADFDVVDAWNRGEAPECSWARQFGVASASDSVYRMRRSSVASSSTCQTVVRANPLLRLLTGDFAMLETECEPWQYHGHASADRFAQIDGLGLPYGGMAARGRPGEHVSAEIADLRAPSSLATLRIVNVVIIDHSICRCRPLKILTLVIAVFYIKCLNTFEHFMMKYRDSEK